MALETGTFISDLVATNPTGSDPLAFADDHLRLLKSTLKNTFPNVTGAVSKTHTQINTAVDQAGTAVQPSVMDAAIAAAVAATKSALYPVGSIYVNAGVTTNPATLLGFGTWVAFGAGRVMVGLNGSDALFDALEETGGSKDAIVVSHTHTMAGAGAHAHELPGDLVQGGTNTSPSAVTDSNTRPMSQVTDPVFDHTHTIDSAGSSGTNANLQPYITVAMWKRTA